MSRVQMFEMFHGVSVRIIAQKRTPAVTLHYCLMGKGQINKRVSVIFVINHYRLPWSDALLGAALYSLRLSNVIIDRSGVLMMKSIRKGGLFICLLADVFSLQPFK